MKKSRPSNRNELRIIGGEFRSRKLSFPDVEGLRPTGNRIRETLFNWLAPFIPGSRCLDLFAGSGAFGLEALSRGASHVTFIDISPLACQHIRNNLNMLDQTLLETGKATVICGNSLLWLNQTHDSLKEAFNIIFLDPPFSADLLQPACDKLADSILLSDECYIYLEQPLQQLNAIRIPENWRAGKDKKAGNISYRLFRRN